MQENNVLHILTAALEASFRSLASSEEGLHATILYYPSHEYRGDDTSLLGLYTDEADALRASAQYLIEKARDLKGADTVSLGTLREQGAWVVYVSDGTRVSSRYDLSEYVVVAKLPADAEFRVQASLPGWV